MDEIQHVAVVEVDLYNMLREPKTQREFCLHRNKDGTLDFTGVLSGDSSGRRHLSVFRNWNCDENGDVLG